VRRNTTEKSLLLAPIAAIALASPALSDPATSGAAPAGKQPAAKAQEEKALVSMSAMSAADFAACVSALRSDKVVFEELGAAKDEGCELSGAVRLVSVATPFGDVAIAGKPTMLCSFARQFSAWSRDVAAPLTLAYTGQRLAEIAAGSAFACRARYDKPGAVPSEHAKGDAIDILSFGLADNGRIRVKEPESDIPQAHDLVRALRTTACGYFTTVLGPGSDSFHADHLHFDTGLHGGTTNYRICE
jgi:hypothetical protein